MAKGEKKARFFSCVSYIKETEKIIDIINSKRTSIRAYAFIKHDKDSTDIHHHIVLRTNTTWTCPAISKWFKQGTDQNTFVQNVFDRNGIIEYLTHENEDNEKHKYDQSEIIDGGVNDILPKGQADDFCAEIVEKMLEGVSCRELVNMYGRDFVYHYSHYMAVMEAIKDEECKN